MGGASIAITSPYYMSFFNPAGYTSIALTTFEAAVKGNFYEVKSSSTKGYANNITLGYFALGFPLKKEKAGLSLGLLPFSRVGYNISSSQTNADGDVEQHKYEGDGGLNQFYIGAGWAPVKNLSVGVNASFIFGTLQQIRKIEFPYNSTYYNTKIAESTNINDIYFNAGILKTFDSLTIAKSDSLVMLEKNERKLKDSIAISLRALHLSAMKQEYMEQRSVLADAITVLQGRLIENDSLMKHVLNRRQKSNWSLSIGLTFAPTTNILGTHTVLQQSYLFNYGQNLEISKDTVLNIQDKKGDLTLPFSIGTGICVKQGTRWTFASDFSLQNWSDYSLFGERDSLANSWRVSGGLQWTPNDRSNKSYFKLIQYRFGLHYEQTYLQLHDNNLNDMGLSIGFGFPMRKTATTIQTSIEVGRRGTISDNLIELNYLKCSIAFTINDRWFIKSKFD